ncbi:LPXTG cell wall anchor domain-containing protein [Lactobacillus hominis]|uniref:Uncharacterized protein n=1 Tax=Lactobacillus hominis DSM 23910 = CRBIP 24.179 TaxID=1423758 RepID=I7LAI5_9LACO|nr:LPXTG cell wall anchor domain-containing protein [Lactobacillus hominis]MCT3348186.1 LPXTG cell wall anchor domain-containing protein [Lactobacillus hominis]CCI82279.1 Protein of unknown function [Lactobacillus hominis DSM 23910 = CRBIP 24.179]
MNFILTTLPHTGAVANWIWGIIGFILAALAVMLIIACTTQRDKR